MAERALLTTLQAGCLAPIGALADVADGEDGPEMWLRAVVARPRRQLARTAVGDRPTPMPRHSATHSPANC